MLASWLLFPAVLAALAAGAGLLVERTAGLRLPGAALIPVGLAALIVVAQLATASPSTAELAVPAAVVVAALGLVLGWRRLGGIDPWAALAGLATFAVYLAPVALSGEATFAGYTKLDDTATWFALTDRVLEHGRDVAGLAPSTYEATLAFNLADGYPVGSLLPLGIGSKLVGEDVAWVFQPYLALLAAGLALCVYALAGGLLRSRPLRAAVAVLAAQAALLYGYALWGGVKELAGALLVALVAVLVATALAGRGPRAALPVAIAVAATIAALSPAGAIVWAGPVLLAACGVALLAGEARARLGQGLVLLVALAALAAPWLSGLGFLPPTSSPLTDDAAAGNLLAPLSPLQAAGVWPAADLRLDPQAPGATRALAVAVGLAAVLAVGLAWRRRARAPFLYGAGVALAAAATGIAGSPWVAAKGFAIASPAVLGLGLIGLAASGRMGSGPRLLRVLGPAAAALLFAAVAAAVVWSTVLAYRGASLAPADRYGELERIGRTVAGLGPTLMPEYDPYGARHFLRDADPESASELRRRRVPRRGGGAIPKGRSADLDQLSTRAVLSYPTLVVRRSPLASRPPAPYRLRRRGERYEVWRRGRRDRVLAHLPLGERRRPDGRAGCRDVQRLASIAGPRGRLVAATQPEAVIAPLGGDRLVLPSTGRHELWLSGPVRGRASARLDGVEVGSLTHELDYPGHHQPLGIARLRPGSRLELELDESPLAPGEGAAEGLPGPLVLLPAGERARLVSVPPGRAGQLCGRRLDWVEAVRRRTPDG